MMRTLLFVFIMVLAIGVSAQSPILQRTFNDGTKSAIAGEFEKALKSYKTALMISENEQLGGYYLAKIHFNLGVCLYRLDKTKQAVLEFNTAIKLRKRDYQRAYYALGMAESQNRNWPEARAAFQKALKINTSDGEAWFDLAFVYLAEKDFENAGRAFRNSISHNSVDSALSHNNVGVILAMSGEFAAAEREFETALLSSGGRLIEAKNNLEYCKARSRYRPELLAKLEFSTKTRSLRISS